MSIRFLSALLLAMPALALAEGSGLDAAQSLTRMALGLLAVMVLIFGLAWAVRRFSFLSSLQGDANTPIRALAQLSVGPKERVVLIEVDGRRLLIGVAPGRVNLLQGSGTFDSQAGTDFAAQLQASREARKK